MLEDIAKINVYMIMVAAISPGRILVDWSFFVRIFLILRSFKSVFALSVILLFSSFDLFFDVAHLFQIIVRFLSELSIFGTHSQ